MDQRRLLLALGLSLLVLLAYNELVLRKYPQRLRQRPRDRQPSGSRPPGQPPVPAARSPPSRPAHRRRRSPVTVHTDVMHLQITPMGARVAKLELERYRETIASNSPPLELIHPGAVLPLTVTVGKDAGDAGVV